MTAKKEVPKKPVELIEAPRKEFVRKKESSIKKLEPTVYDLIAPHAKAAITEKDGKFFYSLVEPDLGEDAKTFKTLKNELVRDIQFSVEDVANPSEYLEKKSEELIMKERMKVTPERREQFNYYLKNEYLGLGKLEPILKDTNIEDISCNGPGIPLYIRHKEYGSLPSNIIFGEEELSSFIMRMAQKCNRFISYAQPLLDGTLPDGSRVQATFSGGISVKGPNFTIRRFKEIPLTPLDMIRYNTGNAELFAYFWEAIENGMSILVSGGTATGKTSFLNAIALFIPPSEKIVSIEDTPEINIPHENWIHSVSRAGYGAENYGEISMFDLLKASFRQRPDYIILGEVRGQEAYVLFQSMASGHPGLGTIHAESVEAIVERLLSPPISLSPSLVELLDIAVIIVFAPKISHNARRIKEIVEIEGISPDGDVRSNASYRWLPVDDCFEFTGHSYMATKIARLRGRSEDDIIAEIKEKEAYLAVMPSFAKNYKEFFDLMSLYYTSKPAFIKKIGLTK